MSIAIELRTMVECVGDHQGALTNMNRMSSYQTGRNAWKNRTGRVNATCSMWSVDHFNERKVPHSSAYRTRAGYHGQ